MIVWCLRSKNIWKFSAQQPTGGHLKLNIPLDQPWNCSYANEGEVQRPVDESNERTTRWWFLMKIGVSALDELQAMKYLITFAGEGYF